MRQRLQSFLSNLYLKDFAVACYWNVRRLPRRVTAADRRLVESYLRSQKVPRFHIGAADHLLDGWLNSDVCPISREAIWLDATQPFPLDDGIFEYVFSEHMIEHVDFEGGKNMLAECFRVLRPGGRMRIATPDLAGLLSLYGQKTAQQDAYIRWSTDTHTTRFHGYDDTVFINNFMRDWGHVFIYDEKTLRTCFERAGFTGFERKAINVSDDPCLRGLENDSRMPDGFLELESIVVEGVKPGGHPPGA